MRARPLILGIAGGSGAGKTTVVNSIVAGLNSTEVAVIQHDSYYRDRGHIPEDERLGVNFDRPEALETELLVKHLSALIEGSSIAVPIYDFTTHTRTPETVHVEPTQLIIVEGILILADPALRQLLDIKVFVEADPDVRLVRRMERDMSERGRSFESVVQQYLHSVRPMHIEFVEPTKRYADLIIPEGGFNEVAVGLLTAKLDSVLYRNAPGPD
jgi:uridine kinase